MERPVRGRDLDRRQHTRVILPPAAASQATPTQARRLAGDPLEPVEERWATPTHRARPTARPAPRGTVWTDGRRRPDTGAARELPVETGTGSPASPPRHRPVRGRDPRCPVRLRSVGMPHAVEVSGDGRSGSTGTDAQGAAAQEGGSVQLPVAPTAGRDDGGARSAVVPSAPAAAAVAEAACDGARRSLASPATEADAAPAAAPTRGEGHAAAEVPPVAQDRNSAAAPRDRTRQEVDPPAGRSGSAPPGEPAAGLPAPTPPAVQAPAAALAGSAGGPFAAAGDAPGRPGTPGAVVTGAPAVEGAAAAIPLVSPAGEELPGRLDAAHDRDAGAAPEAPGVPDARQVRVPPAAEAVEAPAVPRAGGSPPGAAEAAPGSAPTADSSAARQAGMPPPPETEGGAPVEPAAALAEALPVVVPRGAGGITGEAGTVDGVDAGDGVAGGAGGERSPRERQAAVVRLRAALTAPERRLLRWTNAARRSARLPALRLHPALLRAARAKCAEILRTRQVRHDGPHWASPLELQRGHGVRLRVMGAENLAWQADLARAFLALMASPGHRANMLFAEHDRVGLCVRPTWPRGVAVCLEFGGT